MNGGPCLLDPFSRGLSPVFFSYCSVRQRSVTFLHTAQVLAVYQVSCEAHGSEEGTGRRVVAQCTGGGSVFVSSCLDFSSVSAVSGLDVV